MFKGLGVLALVLIAIAFVLLGPFLVIWSWNTLFGNFHMIGYTVWTWCAVLIIGVFVRGDVKVSKKD